MLKKLNQLEKQLEDEKKLQKMLYLSLSLNTLILGYILTHPRGGADYVIGDTVYDVSEILKKCKIAEGVGFLDDPALVKKITRHFKKKLKTKIIFITATSLCHFIDFYGREVLNLSFGIGSFGLTNIYETFRKFLAFMLVMLSIGCSIATTVLEYSRTLYLISLMLLTYGLRLGMYEYVRETSPILEVNSVKDITPRVPNYHDVVVVNNRHKIILDNPVKHHPECILVHQLLLNDNCSIKPTQVPDAVDSILFNLNYNDVVNMKDFTPIVKNRLNKNFDFGDVYDLVGQPVKPSLKKRIKAKMVRFLEMYGDPKNVDDKDSW